ncbi:hypothetical protein PanWU01x14_204630 [Parasponia andersonii]|uniref:Uncharacterized protein n=1 Tax=Parasponia andersonii TaxID=3476 RepID=A0A2P5BWB2_PARAD|nr:hypothetical protein PanWU01x14_204630 [Parasponia andersonii]
MTGIAMTIGESRHHNQTVWHPKKCPPTTQLGWKSPLDTIAKRKRTKMAAATSRHPRPAGTLLSIFF